MNINVFCVVFPNYCHFGSCRGEHHFISMVVRTVIQCNDDIVSSSNIAIYSVLVVKPN